MRQPAKNPLGAALGIVMMAACSAQSTPPPQVPVKQAYASEVASTTTPIHQLQPDLDAKRLMQVRVSGGFWAKTYWDALFYSDGTLQVYEVTGAHTLRPSAKLTAAELKRLVDDMPALDICRIHAEKCNREDVTDDGAVRFEVYSGAERGEPIMHYQGSRATPPEFLRYEAFVLYLIRQTTAP